MNKLNLDPRERLSFLLGVMLLIVVLGLLWYIPSGPKRDYDAARTQLQGLETDLLLAISTRNEEEARRDSQKILKERVVQRDANFELLPYIQTLLNENNLGERAGLSYARLRDASASQPMVNVSLTNVGLNELLDFLHKVYSSDKLIAMYKLDGLGPANNRQGLDCNITLVTLKIES